MFMTENKSGPNFIKEDHFREIIMFDLTQFLFIKAYFFMYTIFQCLQHRALNPDEALPDLSPIIAECLKPPQEVMSQCSEKIEKLKEKFKLEIVKKKEDKTGDTMFKQKYLVYLSVFFIIKLDLFYETSTIKLDLFYEKSTYNLY